MIGLDNPANLSDAWDFIHVCCDSTSEGGSSGVGPLGYSLLLIGIRISYDWSVWVHIAVVLGF